LIAIGERSLLYPSDTYHALAKFSLGDKVSFTNNGGETVAGIVVRVNKKTVSIHTDDHQHWNVSPHLLKKVGGSSKQERADNVIELFEGQKS